VDEHVIVEGMPVQILPIYSALVAEASKKAIKKTVGSETVWVMRAEHLLAIMASLSRPKDKARIPLVLSQAKIDKKFLKGVLSRYGLVEKWKKIVE
jgi:hypothetical protein